MKASSIVGDNRLIITSLPNKISLCTTTHIITGHKEVSDGDFKKMYNEACNKSKQ